MAPNETRPSSPSPLAERLETSASAKESSRMVAEALGMGRKSLGNVDFESAARAAEKALAADGGADGFAGLSPEAALARWKKDFGYRAGFLRGVAHKNSTEAATLAELLSKFAENPEILRAALRHFDARREAERQAKEDLEALWEASGNRPMETGASVVKVPEGQAKEAGVRYWPASDGKSAFVVVMAGRKTPKNAKKYLVTEVTMGHIRLRRDDAPEEAPETLASMVGRLVAGRAESAESPSTDKKAAEARARAAEKSYGAAVRALGKSLRGPVLEAYEKTKRAGGNMTAFQANFELLVPLKLRKPGNMRKVAEFAAAALERREALDLLEKVTRETQEITEPQTPETESGIPDNGARNQETQKREENAEEGIPTAGMQRGAMGGILPELSPNGGETLVVYGKDVGEVMEKIERVRRIDADCREALEGRGSLGEIDGTKKAELLEEARAEILRILGE